MLFVGSWISGFRVRRASPAAGMNVLIGVRVVIPDDLLVRWKGARKTNQDLAGA